MMGLQATATKRKYEMSAYEDGDMETNCSPAKLSCRWAANTTTTTTTLTTLDDTNDIITITTLTNSPPSSPPADNVVDTPMAIESHSEISTAKMCVVNSSAIMSTTTTSAEVTKIPRTQHQTDEMMDDDQTVPKVVVINQQQQSSLFLSVASTTNHQQNSSAEDSIAKLEAVTVPGETWSVTEPIDSIQKLQAVAVPPCDRSTLATTLLSPDELDDDDDFEDDFDEDETAVPNYPSMRYPSSPNPYIYIPPGFQKHFIHYKEPYTQQSCQKNQNYRMGSTQQQPPLPPQHPLPPSSQSHYGSCNYYYPPSHPDHNSSQQQPPQQTIRCAENGKSYLELGSVNDNRNGSSGVSGFGGYHHHHHQPDMYMRYVKRCCEGKSNWCNNNKQCYREKRHKMMNLSMFKLSRFRQLSEQNMLRSVLICNTLKLIEKEIKAENKECRSTPCGAVSVGGAGVVQHLNPHHTHGLNSESTLNKINTSPSYCQTSQMNGANNNAMNSSVLLRGGVGGGGGVDVQTISNLDSSNDEMFSNIRSSTPVPSSFCNGNSTGETPGINPQHMNQNPLAAIYDHHQQQNHPLRDQSPGGRATPFPMLGLPDNDSGFGDEDCTRPINWGSVLSLSSQSALDPINNNDLFSSITSCSTLTSSGVATASACWGDYNILESDLGLDSSDLTELVPSWKLTADEILKSVPPPMEPSKIMMDNEIDTFTHIMVGS